MDAVCKIDLQEIADQIDINSGRSSKTARQVGLRPDPQQVDISQPEVTTAQPQNSSNFSTSINQSLLNYPHRPKEDRLHIRLHPLTRSW